MNFTTTIFDLRPTELTQLCCTLIYFTAALQHYKKKQQFHACVFVCAHVYVQNKMYRLIIMWNFNSEIHHARKLAVNSFGTGSAVAVLHSYT